jgi:hypothetical protein
VPELLLNNSEAKSLVSLLNGYLQENSYEKRLIKENSRSYSWEQGMKESHFINEIHEESIKNIEQKKYYEPRPYAPAPPPEPFVLTDDARLLLELALDAGLLEGKQPDFAELVADSGLDAKVMEAAAEMLRRGCVLHLGGGYGEPQVVVCHRDLEVLGKKALAGLSDEAVELLAALVIEGDVTKSGLDADSLEDAYCDLDSARILELDDEGNGAHFRLDPDVLETLNLAPRIKALRSRRRRIRLGARERLSPLAV